MLPQKSGYFEALCGIRQGLVEKLYFYKSLISANRLA